MHSCVQAAHSLYLLSEGRWPLLWTACHICPRGCQHCPWVWPWWPVQVLAGKAGHVLWLLEHQPLPSLIQMSFIYLTGKRGRQAFSLWRVSTPPAFWIWWSPAKNIYLTNIWSHFLHPSVSLHFCLKIKCYKGETLGRAAATGWWEIRSPRR